MITITGFNNRNPLNLIFVLNDDMYSVSFFHNILLYPCWNFSLNESFQQNLHKISSKVNFYGFRCIFIKYI